MYKSECSILGPEFGFGIPIVLSAPISIMLHSPSTQSVEMLSHYFLFFAQPSDVGVSLLMTPLE